MRLVLAPMAGFTHSAFRRLCKELGANILYTELINATGIVKRGLPKELSFFKDEERPLHFQIYGRDAEEISQAAAIVAQKEKPEFVDLNFGCPVRKVVKNRSGAYLLQFPKLLRKITEQTVKAVQPYGVKVSAKIRLGFDEDNLEKIAEALIEGGVSLIALHARTAKMMFSGKASWERIADLKRISTVPVFGNGDVKTWRDAYKMAEITGCDGVMIGRAALSNPWIFKEILIKKDIRKDSSERANFILRELTLMWEFMEREKSCKEIKAQIAKIFKGVRGKNRILERLLKSKSCKELIENLKEISEPR